MITQYGMSQNLGAVTFEREGQAFLSGGAILKEKEYSESTAQKIDQEIRQLIDANLSRATECLKKNEAFVREAVRRIVETETLNENELRALWTSLGLPGNKLKAG